MKDVLDDVRVAQGLGLLRIKIMEELKAKLLDKSMSIDLRIQEVHKASAAFNQIDVLIDTYTVGGR